MLAGACDALSTPRPLGPLLDVAAECDALAEALAGAVQPSEVFAVLRDELAEQPTVLVIEDLHWGDEATFDVLRLLSRRMDVPSIVVSTYRDDALAPRSPMRVLLGDLATSATVERLALEPLSAAAVGQLAAGYDVDPADLYARTGGNPFFVAQVLATGEAGVPATVRDAVLARTSGSRSRRSRSSRRSPSPCRAPSRGCSKPSSTTAAVTSTSASRPGSSQRTRDTVAFRHELARAAVDMRSHRRAGSRFIAASSRALTPRAPPRSTPRGSRTTPRPQATPTRFS